MGQELHFHSEKPIRDYKPNFKLNNVPTAYLTKGDKTAIAIGAIVAAGLIGIAIANASNGDKQEETTVEQGAGGD